MDLEGKDEMTTLTRCVNKAIKEGYTANFQVIKSGDNLYLDDSVEKFGSEDIKVDTFYRFEGASDPADNAILYVITTNAGTKGTLIDAYGAGADANVSEFMKQVEDIQKQKLKQIV